MHHEMATRNSFSITEMAFATPLKSLEVVDRLRALKNHKMTRDDWISAEREFLSYCLEQDEAYVRIPTDPTVSGCSDAKRLTELMAKFARGEKLDDEENR
jgi:hypothetical protein